MGRAGALISSLGGGQLGMEVRGHYRTLRMRSPSLGPCDTHRRLNFGRVSFLFESLGILVDRSQIMSHKGKGKASDNPAMEFVTKEEIGAMIDDKIKAAVTEAIQPLLTAPVLPSASDNAASGSKEGAQTQGEL